MGLGGCVEWVGRLMIDQERAESRSRKPTATSKVTDKVHFWEIEAREGMRTQDRMGEW
jgi:hypothetical protein